MSETMTENDAIVWRADAEDGGSVWVHANGEWGYEGGSMGWALDGMAAKIAEDTQKDAVIKALADALESFGGMTDSGDLCFCPAFGGHSERCLASRAALRLAGRL